eukprot:GAHX01000463.1.p1 GENE.GAHX01000463.1~~GAHX01000463.1.p1  ORF type:complete len:378 (+),score=65.65 GAHX01000463.1:54-1187(+)
MARGPRHHLKRLQAPKNWHLSKLKGIFAPKQLPGPHRTNEAIPLTVLLRNLMGYAQNANEAKIILTQGHILVNGKVRTDGHFGVGLMDIVHIPTLNLTFRLILNSRGNWSMVSPSYNAAVFARPLPTPLPEVAETHEESKAATEDSKKKKGAFSSKDASSKLYSTKNNFDVLNIKNEVKKTKKKASLSSSLSNQKNDGVKTCVVPCKVKQRQIGYKNVVGINKAATNPSDRAIPWCSTYCGRTLRYVDKNIKAGDTVFVKITSTPCKSQRTHQKYNYKIEQKIVKHIKLEEGKLGYISRGKNAGRVGRIKKIEQHVMISNVLYMEDELGNKFSSNIENIFIIGDDHSEIGLANDRGVRMSLENRIKLNLEKSEVKDE